MSQHAPDCKAIQDWSITYLSRTLDIPSEKVNADEDVDSFGLDSTTAVAYMMSLEEWLGIELMPELLFEHPTISKLSKHVAGMLDHSKSR